MKSQAELSPAPTEASSLSPWPSSRVCLVSLTLRNSANRWLGGGSGSPASLKTACFEAVQLSPGPLQALASDSPESSWVPGRRRVCPGVCSRPWARCVCSPELECHPQCVCVALGLLCLSGEDTVNLLGSSGSVCPFVSLCVHVCQHRQAPAGLPVGQSHRPHLWVVPAWSRAPSPVPLFHQLGGSVVPVSLSQTMPLPPP